METNFSEYENAAGSDWGSAGQQSVDELNKALTVGQSTSGPGGTPGDAFAMRVESLEATMKVTSYRMEHIRFFKLLPKLGASNTVEEYSELSSYGVNPDAGWIAEGDLPETDDSTFTRRYSVVKYLGTTRKVSHQATLIKAAHGPIIAGETIRGTIHLLKILERALFYGDSDLSALQFDGLQKQITSRSPAGNIFDLRGQPISEDILTDGCLTIQDAPNYGTPTHLLSNPRVKADLVKQFFPKERYDLFSKPKNGMVGLDIQGFVSPAGDVQFVPDVFIDDGGAPGAAAGDSTKRPATPTASALSSPADALSQFTADDAGDYQYKACAVNRYGRSACVSANVSGVVAGDKVTFTLTPGDSVEVSWYEIYRTKVNGAAGTERSILKVANGAGAGAQTINDYNASLPYCSSAFLVQLNLECMSLKSLTPMVKMPLATIDTSTRWMQLIYCVPNLYTPGKVVLLKNVGRAEGSF